MARTIGFYSPDQGACGAYRCLWPVQHCRQQLAKDGIHLGITQTLTPCNAVIVSKVLQPEPLEELARLKAAGTRVVWSTDDNMLALPSWNPASRFYTPETLGLVARLLELADEAVVSTRPLAEALGRRFAGPIHVTPNLIDPEHWDWPRPDHDDLRVLWAGSIHHSHDLLEIVGPVERMLARRPAVRMFFMGDMPAAFADYAPIPWSNYAVRVPHERYAGRVGYVEPVALQEYPRTLAILAADVALCPLAPNTPFNDSKSGIKWLECSMSGAAVIASDEPPYRCIRDGVDGLLAGGARVGVRDGVVHVGARTWDEALDQLLDDHEGRRAMARAARERILREHSWDCPGRDVWVDFFRKAAG